MLSSIANSVYVRFFWGLMGIYILNLCVDPAVPDLNRILNVPAYNDQESLAEIIVEKLMGFEDAFEEHDDGDTEENKKRNNIKVDLMNTLSHSSVLDFPDNRKLNPSNFIAYLDKGSGLPATPPPEN